MTMPHVLPIPAMEHFGLDLRARSALRAYAANDSSEAMLRRCTDCLESALADPADTAIRRHELRQFIEVFCHLPAVDFDHDWLRRLAESWQFLRRAGGAGDLPLRAARALVSHGATELLKGRPSLSALEVEIVGALSAAGMYVAEWLSRLTAVHDAETVVDDAAEHVHHSSLRSRLAAAIGAAGERTVGLLMVRLRTGPGLLSLSVEQRETLWEAAIDRVRSVLREADILVRTEFHACALILPDLQGHAQVLLAATKVAHALEMPLTDSEGADRVAVTIGAVWSPDHGRTAEELVRCAEMAVEAARREEKSLVVFDGTMMEMAQREAKIEKEFPSALESGQIVLHVQPQIELGTGRCIGGELLLRWDDSEGNAIPAYRIPIVARRIGAAPRLTRWLVLGACRALSELDRSGVDVRLSLNLMGRDVMDRELPLLVAQAIDFWRVQPARLMFELTEGMMLEDPLIGAEVMRRLIELGVSTSIDDFGIGYSSILYLRQLPLHELKLDCAFVLAMSSSRQDREIVASLIQLAHALGLQTVAEGIEDEQTFALLREMGCDRGQGYWISRAMPTADFPAWVREWNGRRP